MRDILVDPTPICIHSFYPPSYARLFFFSPTCSSASPIFLDVNLSGSRLGSYVRVWLAAFAWVCVERTRLILYFGPNIFGSYWRTRTRAHSLDSPVPRFIYDTWQPTTFLLNEIRIVDFVEKLEESITRADIMNDLFRDIPRDLAKIKMIITMNKSALKPCDYRECLLIFNVFKPFRRINY